MALAPTSPAERHDPAGPAPADVRGEGLPGRPDLISHAGDATKVLVIGLGNPILGEDGVGWQGAGAVGRALATTIQSAGLQVEVDYASLGGLRLMERMLGYERVILVDSMETGLVPEGHLHVCRLEELPDRATGHSASAHDTSLRVALELGRACGEAIPSRVDVVGIEACNMFNFSESLSEPVLQAVPRAVAAVSQLLVTEEK